ncbi:unnamed protein product, partial [Brenthis ino]
MDSSPLISSHATSYTANFEKLEGSSNFHTWKFSIKNILILEGLWDVIEGSDDDVVRQQRALARICLSVKKELYQYVRNATSAAAAWKNLAEVFEDRGLYRRVLLLRKLHRVEFTAYSSMNAYIENVTTLVQQLHDIGRTIEDAEIAEILLSGLPSEYDTLVSGLSTATVTNQITSELVKARLLQEYSRKTSLGDTAAYITRKKAPLFCEFCKKRNHRKSQCFKLKKMKSSRPASIETISLASAFVARLSSQVFVLDSGASSHMVNNKRLLCNFVPDDQAITIANNEQIKSEGQGQVDLRFKQRDEDLKSYLTGISPLIALTILSATSIAALSLAETCEACTDGSGGVTHVVRDVDGARDTMVPTAGPGDSTRAARQW